MWGERIESSKGSREENYKSWKKGEEWGVKSSGQRDRGKRMEELVEGLGMIKLLAFIF